MTVSTNGQICYGVLCDEMTEFPWDTDEWQNDIEEWWTYGMCDYKNPFELFDSKGDYINGVKPPEKRLKEYFHCKREFEKEHPLPITLINYCSDNHPLYIIALPKTVRIASRGYPEIINPQDKDLIISISDKATLIGFCKIHNIDFDGEPQWYLSSYWG